MKKTRPLLHSWHSGHLLSTMLAGGISALGYLYFGYQSNLDAGLGLFEFLGGHFFLAGVLLGYWYYLFLQGREIGYGPVILWAVIFRLIGVYGSPILEDDYFRYLLDGCVFVATGTPYGVSPESLFVTNTLPAACQELLSRVNNPGVPTIYGPVLQYVFALANLISPANVKVLQLILSVFDLGLILLLCRYASARNVMLYAWSPLVVKEIIFTAHPDVIAITLMVAAFHFRKLKYPGIAVTLIALASAAKVFALLVLPFIVFRLRLRYWFLCAVVLALMYLPFLLRGTTELAVLDLFARQWQFNASLFLLVSSFVGDPAARLTSLGLFALWWLIYFFFWAKAGSSTPDSSTADLSTTNPLTLWPRGEWVFGVFLLLSPVVNPWYVIWLLPFAVVRPRIWCWTLATVVSLSYVTGLNNIDSGLSAYQISPWAYYSEIFVVLVALTIDKWKSLVSPSALPG